ncbi:cytochrome P450 [Tuber magnatum]|uniref:Cytochrome P450 n=1 Tax=Tuber magnatum TaxID=42249 RepID=A0A317SGI0_9PEZI|nr:cytochrome P450 [Tuber magnatum]
MGIFSVDGVSWSHSRALLRPSFDRANVSDLGQLEGFMQIFFSRINELPRQPLTHTRAVELQELFQCLTMDSSTDFLFGDPIGALASKKYTLGNGEMAFDKAFDIAQYGLAMRAPLSSFYWLYNGREFRKACSTARAQVAIYVSRALRKLNLAEKKSGEEGLGKKYVFLEELAERTQDPQVLQDQVLNVMLAGRDTTAALLSWTFLCLARNPEVYKKLRAEISAVVGVDEDARLPTQAELRSIQYLRWIIQEVLRLYPPVALNARRALHATTLPYGGGPDGNSPISIRKGERIVYSVFSLHRRTDLYGPDANEFRPERWGEEALRRIGWGWLPFNGGPRICLGQQMALTHASYFVTRMMQVYKEITPKDFALADDSYDTKLVMASGRGVHVFLF